MDGSNYSLKWEGLPDFENTWEDLEVIKKQIPGLHLEDKVDFEGVENVRPYGLTYSRKKIGGKCRRAELSNTPQVTA